MPIKRTSSTHLNSAASNTLNQKPSRDWPHLMAKLSYICCGLAVILVFVQFNLYSWHYNKAYDSTPVSAVVMANGQTYFGHMQKFGPHTVVLFDVYYLQVSDETDAAEVTDEATANAETDATGNIKLVKLSDDFYQPNNYIMLNRDQVISWQHLSDNSPIISAIAEYKTKASE